MLVNLSYSTSGKINIVCDKFILLLFFLIEKSDDAEIMFELLHEWIISKGHHLIFQYSGLTTKRKSFCNKNICIFLGSGYKEYALFIQGAEPLVIDVSAVKCKDASSCQVEASFFLCLCYFVYSSFCHSYHFWDIASIIQENVYFEGSFGAFVLCPWKYGKAEINDSCIQGIERILKRKFFF